ncbi:MAG: hypothetical protein RML93_11215 [Anaerolineales bacterium]|nr:hypothetical protein [Anaerolineales bacterium]MCS7249006.1 hypothetical protein [Anaerolineales bacterium]MDW8162819.1 hypothetical protein [Anaerolineales bacterium]MDW8447845.1 hypothetical protein [Anaerolineales bacterium]
MVSPVFVVLCDYGLFDSWRRRVSAIGIFDYFSAAVFPTRLRFDVVSKWMADEGGSEGDFMIRIVSPDRGGGQRSVLWSTPPERMVFDLFTRTATNTAHFDLQAPIAGDYQIEFYFNGELIHTKALPVIPED